MVRMEVVDNHAYRVVPAELRSVAHVAVRPPAPVHVHARRAFPVAFLKDRLAPNLVVVSLVVSSSAFRMPIVRILELLLVVWCIVLLWQLWRSLVLLLIVVIGVSANALPQSCGQDRLPAASASASASASSR